MIINLQQKCVHPLIYMRPDLSSKWNIIHYGKQRVMGPPVLVSIKVQFKLQAHTVYATKLNKTNYKRLLQQPRIFIYYIVVNINPKLKDNEQQ